MSSGLPINTYNQAAEYRKRYLASLALEVQNDAYNLQANQVYRQTGQPSRPPDSRSTTEKLADLEGMKVSLRSGLMSITDGTQANETLERLTPDEVIFTSQQLPAIVSELKPRFARGVPADALIQYIRSLRRKFLETNGVSFTAQESTAQQILNAIQAGRNQMGAPPGPIPGGAGVPPGAAEAPQGEFQEDPEVEAQRQRDTQRQAQVRRRALQFLDGVEYDANLQQVIGPDGRPVRIRTEPISSLPREVQEMINAIRAERGGAPPAGQALQIGAFRNDETYQAAAGMFGPDSIDEWNAYPRQGGFAPYPDSEEIQKEFLKMWARRQAPAVQAEFSKNWQSKKSLSALKTALTPGVILKLSDIPEGEINPMDIPLSIEVPSGVNIVTPADTPVSSVVTTQETSSDVSTRQSGIPSAVILLERIGSGRFSQKQLEEDVGTFLRVNKLYDKLESINGRKINSVQRIYFGDPDRLKANDLRILPEDTNLLELIRQVRGKGMKVPVRRAGEPASRYPTGRDILGYGLRVPKQSKKAIQIDITKGVVYNPESTFVPFGKYIVNPNKLSSGVFEIKTMRGGLVAKYPILVNTVFI